jgi:DNA-binding transcriptional ArsR family regulator
VSQPVKRGRVSNKETNMVTARAVSIYRVLRETGMVSSHEIVRLAGVTPRTARRHLKRLFDLGIATYITALGKPEYWLLPAPRTNEGREYVARIERAANVLGITIAKHRS